MSAGQCVLDVDGKLLLRDGGKVFLSNGADDSCCCGGGTPGDGPCYTVAGFDPWFHTPDLAAMGLTDVMGDGTITFHENGYWAHSPCHRLLVWDLIAIASNTIPSSIGAPDHVLMTNGRLCYRPSLPTRAPFYSDWPTNTLALDATPYWYSGCAVGGWQTSTVGRVPTGTQLNTMWASTPIPDGNYILLAGVRTRRRYVQASPYGPGTPTSALAEDAAGFKVVYLALTK